MIRRWDVILHGCGGTVAFPRGATLATRPAPPHWAWALDGGPSANGIEGRKTLKFDAFTYSTSY